MFTEHQQKLLEAPLDSAKVRTRPQAGRDLSYIEGWHAIAECNRIFGFGNWERHTDYCKEVSRTEFSQKHKVGYEAKVRVIVRQEGQEIVREGTGHGSGIAKDLFDAIEGAAKEAETDAMKRALMTFGNPFGLALYDKEQKNVEDTSAALKREAAAIKSHILSLANKESVLEYLQSDDYAKATAGMPSVTVDWLTSYAHERIDKLG